MNRQVINNFLKFYQENELYTRNSQGVESVPIELEELVKELQKSKDDKLTDLKILNAQIFSILSEYTMTGTINRDRLEVAKNIMSKL